MERVPPVESKIGGTGWTEGGEGSPERRARAGDRIEHNTTTGGLESGREKCGPVELRGVRRLCFPCLHLIAPPGFKHRVVALCFAGAGAPVLRRGVPQSATQSCSGHPPILLSIGGRSAIDFLSFPATGTREGRKEKQGKGGRKEGRKEGRKLDLFDPKRPLPFWRTSASLSDPRNAFPSHLLFLSAWSRSVTQPWGSI